MTDRIYSVEPDGSLRALDSAPYDSEDLLQRLLAQYPDLLAGEQVDALNPRRWMLVSREHAVADSEGGPGRWSLDHLFLDQDAIPTLVEVKRSTDTRIRREVIGQMLDYAANAVLYWPVEQLRAQLANRCQASDDDPHRLVAELVGAELNNGMVEEYWTRVKTNLQAGRIRLVFVADQVPSELRRVVEFLNEQMDPAEVLAVEIRQYVGHGSRTLVPSVIGATATAIGRKSVGRQTGKAWTEETFMQALSQKQGEAATAVARELLAWIQPRVTNVWWGRGATDGSMIPVLELNGGRERGGQNLLFFAVWTYGVIEMQFQHLAGKRGFEALESRKELLDRVNRVPGVALPADSLSRRPSFPLLALLEPAPRLAFQEAIEWGIEHVRHAGPPR